MQARWLPRDDEQCAWWALLPEDQRAAGPPLTGDQEADCVVLGAGYTGLATARRLAERQPGWRIALIDAQRVGLGSSGRNSGFVGDIAHRNPNIDANATHRIKRLASAGRDALAELVREHSIRCDWSDVGRLHVARERTALANLEHLLGVLDKFGEPHQRMSAESLAAVLGTDYYRAGVHIPGTALVQPAALARGLARSLPGNVELFENSPVTEIEVGPPHRIAAGSGTMRTARLFVATNAFAPALGFLRRRVIPLLTFASLTRPLTDSERAQVGGDAEWGLVSEDRMGTSLRRTRDHRLLVRNTVKYRAFGPPTAGDIEAARDSHQRSLVARFPAWSKVELEYSWWGVLGMTLNQAQYFGALGAELYASVGYNGTGVAMGTGCGVALADLALGGSPLTEDAMALARPVWVPPDPFLGWGVGLYTAFLQRRAGGDR